MNFCLDDGSVLASELSVSNGLRRPSRNELAFWFTFRSSPSSIVCAQTYVLLTSSVG